MLHHGQPVAGGASNYPHLYAPQAPVYHHDPRHVASILGGYAPVPIALHTPPHPQEQFVLAHQEQHAAAAGYNDRNIRRVDRPSALCRPRGTPQQQQHHHHQQFTNMPPPPQMKAEDFDELQQLSADYEPAVTGPLVGQRQNSTAITNEYATADPVYQQKTAALPQKYAHYRTVRGDGRCGWRAVGFAFFERLAFLGEPNRFVEQEARLRSLSNILNAAGFSPFIYEDFADSFFALMRNLTDAVSAGEGQAEAVLLDAFNDEHLQAAIITHLRTLTAAWMKTRPNDYVNYTPGLNVDQYCDDSVTPYGSEIEELSLSALNDVLLAPAGVALEVLYLDRSAGPEVNLHRFGHIGQNGHEIACVRLLYRPGHYDILYKPEDVPPPVMPVSTYLNFANQPFNDPINAIDNSELMTIIPGMSTCILRQPIEWASAPNYELPAFFPTPTSALPSIQPASTPTAAPTAPAITAAQPQAQAQSIYLPPQRPALPQQSRATKQELPIRTASRSAHQLSIPQHLGGSSGPFRHSQWELKPGIIQATAQLPFRTAIFRNSHFNTAHFNNPDFQPEEWSPDAEYVTVVNKSSRQRATG